METEALLLKFALDITSFYDGINIVIEKLDGLIIMVDEFTVKMDDVSNKLDKTSFDEFAENIGLAASGITILGTVLGLLGIEIPALTTIFGGLSTALAGTGIVGVAAFAWVFGIIAAITILFFAIRYLIKNWDKTKELFGNIGKAIGDKVKEVWTNITDFFTNIKFEDFIKVGRLIITSLLIGILGEDFGGIIIKTGQEIIKWFKEALGMHSPSKKMIEIGKFIILGLINGLKGAAKGVLTFIGGFIANVIAWITINVPMIITAVGALFNNLWASITTFFTKLPVVIAEWLLIIINTRSKFLIKGI